MISISESKDVLMAISENLELSSTKIESQEKLKSVRWLKTSLRLFRADWK